MSRRQSTHSSRSAFRGSPVVGRFREWSCAGPHCAEVLKNVPSAAVPGRHACQPGMVGAAQAAADGQRCEAADGLHRGPGRAAWQQRLPPDHGLAATGHRHPEARCGPDSRLTSRTSRRSRHTPGETGISTTCADATLNIVAADTLEPDPTLLGHQVSWRIDDGARGLPGEARKGGALALGHDHAAELPADETRSPSSTGPGAVWNSPTATPPETRPRRCRPQPVEARPGTVGLSGAFWPARPVNVRSGTGANGETPERLLFISMISVD